MSIRKGTGKTTGQDDAKKAYERGDKRFVVLVNQFILLGRDIGDGYAPDFSKIIANIEAEGWLLDHMAWSPGEMKKPVGIFIFKRDEVQARASLVP